jgi:hypothetical protein
MKVVQLEIYDCFYKMLKAKKFYLSFNFGHTTNECVLTRYSNEGTRTLILYHSDLVESMIETLFVDEINFNYRPTDNELHAALLCAEKNTGKVLVSGNCIGDFTKVLTHTTSDVRN